MKVLMTGKVRSVYLALIEHDQTPEVPKPGMHYYQYRVAVGHGVGKLEDHILVTDTFTLDEASKHYDNQNLAAAAGLYEE